MSDLAADSSAAERKRRERRRARHRLQDSILASVSYGTAREIRPALEELGFSCLFQLDQALARAARERQHEGVSKG